MNIEQDLRCACLEATRLGLNLATTVHMLDRYGAVGAARRLLALPDDRGPVLAQLAELSRLDLTIEAVVLRNTQHFHEGEVVAALRRLGRHGYSIELYVCKGAPRRSTRT